MSGKGRTLFGAGISVELEQAFLRLLLVSFGMAYGVIVAYRGVFETGYLTPVVVLGCLYVVFSVVSIFLDFAHTVDLIVSLGSLEGFTYGYEVKTSMPMLSSFFLVLLEVAR